MPLCIFNTALIVSNLYERMIFSSELLVVPSLFLFDGCICYVEGNEGENVDGKVFRFLEYTEEHRKKEMKEGRKQ